MAVPLWCFGGKPWDGGLQGNHLWSCRLVTLHTYIVICKCVCVSVSLWAEAGWQVPELMMMVCWIIDVQMLMNRRRQHEHHRRMRNLYRLASMVTESESWLVYHITTMGAYMVWPESNQWNFVSYVGRSCGLDVSANAEQKTSVTGFIEVPNYVTLTTDIFVSPFLLSDIHGPVVIDIWRLHERRLCDVQQFPSLWHGSALRNG